MRRGVLVAHRPIRAAGDDLTMTDDHRPDRNVARGSGLLRETERLAQEVRVLVDPNEVRQWRESRW